MIWPLILAIVSVVVSIAGAISAARAQKKAKENADARKGFELVVKGEPRTLPIAYGRNKVGAVITGVRLSSNYYFPGATNDGDNVPYGNAQGDTGAALGGTVWYRNASDRSMAENISPNLSRNKNNQFLFVQYAICEGDIECIGDIEVDDQNWNATELAYGQRIHTYNNHAIDHWESFTPCADPLSVANNFPTGNIFKNTAYAVGAFRLNRDDYQYFGVPEPQFYVLGKKIRYYDTNGVGAFGYSNNPAWVLYDYLTSDYGRNLSDDEIDFASFLNAGTVCDTPVSFADNTAIIHRQGRVWKNCTQPEPMSGQVRTRTVSQRVGHTNNFGLVALFGSQTNDPNTAVDSRFAYLGKANSVFSGVASGNPDSLAVNTTNPPANFNEVTKILVPIYTGGGVNPALNDWQGIFGNATAGAPPSSGYVYAFNKLSPTLGNYSSLIFEITGPSTQNTSITNTLDLDHWEMPVNIIEGRYDPFDNYSTLPTKEFNTIYNLDQTQLTGTLVFTSDFQEFVDEGGSALVNGDEYIFYDTEGVRYSFIYADDPSDLQVKTISSDFNTITPFTGILSNMNHLTTLINNTLTLSAGTPGVTATTMPLYECNILIDRSQPVRDNVQDILMTMGQAELIWSEGKYKLQLDYPRTSAAPNPAVIESPVTSMESLLKKSGSFKVTSSNLVRETIKVNYAKATERYNQATVRYHDEAQDFAKSSAVWPEKNSAEYEQYLAEDSNQPLTTSFLLEGITDAYHAKARAEQMVKASRSLATFEFECDISAYRLEPGDFITIDPDVIGIPEVRKSLAAAGGVEALRDVVVKVQSIKITQVYTVRILATKFNFTDLVFATPTPLVASFPRHADFVIVSTDAPTVVSDDDNRTAAISFSTDYNSTEVEHFMIERAGLDAAGTIPADLTSLLWEHVGSVKPAPEVSVASYTDFLPLNAVKVIYRIRAVTGNGRKSPPSPISAIQTFTALEIADTIDADLEPAVVSLVSDASGVVPPASVVTAANAVTVTVVASGANLTEVVDRSATLIPGQFKVSNITQTAGAFTGGTPNADGINFDPITAFSALLTTATRTYTIQLLPLKRTIVQTVTRTQTWNKVTPGSTLDISVDPPAIVFPSDANGVVTSYVDTTTTVAATINSIGLTQVDPTTPDGSLLDEQFKYTVATVPDVLGGGGQEQTEGVASTGSFNLSTLSGAMGDVPPPPRRFKFDITSIITGPTLPAQRPLISDLISNHSSTNKYYVFGYWLDDITLLPTILDDATTTDEDRSRLFDISVLLGQVYNGNTLKFGFFYRQGGSTLVADQRSLTANYSVSNVHSVSTVPAAGVTKPPNCTTFKTVYFTLTGLTDTPVKNVFSQDAANDVWVIETPTTQAPASTDRIAGYASVKALVEIETPITQFPSDVDRIVRTYTVTAKPQGAGIVTAIKTQILSKSKDGSGGLTLDSVVTPGVVHLTADASGVVAGATVTAAANATAVTVSSDGVSLQEVGPTVDLTAGQFRVRNILDDPTDAFIGGSTTVVESLVGSIPSAGAAPSISTNQVRWRSDYATFSTAAALLSSPINPPVQNYSIGSEEGKGALGRIFSYRNQPDSNFSTGFMDFRWAGGFNSPTSTTASVLAQIAFMKTVFVTGTTFEMVVQAQSSSTKTGTVTCRVEAILSLDGNTLPTPINESVICAQFSISAFSPSAEATDSGSITSVESISTTVTATTFTPPTGFSSTIDSAIRTFEIEALPVGSPNGTIFDLSRTQTWSKSIAGDTLDVNVTPASIVLAADSSGNVATNTGGIPDTGTVVSVYANGTDLVEKESGATLAGGDFNYTVADTPTGVITEGLVGAGPITPGPAHFDNQDYQPLDPSPNNGFVFQFTTATSNFDRPTMASILANTGGTSYSLDFKTWVDAAGVPTLDTSQGTEKQTIARLFFDSFFVTGKKLEVIFAGDPLSGITRQRVKHQCVIGTVQRVEVTRNSLGPTGSVGEDSLRFTLTPTGTGVDVGSRTPSTDIVSQLFSVQGSASLITGFADGTASVSRVYSVVSKLNANASEITTLKTQVVSKASAGATGAQGLPGLLSWASGTDYAVGSLVVSLPTSSTSAGTFYCTTAVTGSPANTTRPENLSANWQQIGASFP